MWKNPATQANVALLHEPKLLVLDEPFVGLDPAASFELKKMLHELASEVRLAVATAVNEQIGVSIASVDVYIDSLVFPKE